MLKVTDLIGGVFYVNPNFVLFIERIQAMGDKREHTLVATVLRDREDKNKFLRYEVEETPEQLIEQLALPAFLNVEGRPFEELPDPSMAPHTDPA
jgi:hypothetical protein